MCEISRSTFLISEMRITNLTFIFTHGLRVHYNTKCIKCTS